MKITRHGSVMITLGAIKVDGFLMAPDEGEQDCGPEEMNALVAQTATKWALDRLTFEVKRAVGVDPKAGQEQEARVMHRDKIKHRDQFS